MKYVTEFPEFDAAYMPAIPEGFVDASWHNDACPFFVNVTTHLGIYVDFYTDDMRAFPGEGRYSVVRLDVDGASEEGLLVTDDWNEVLTFLANS